MNLIKKILHSSLWLLIGTTMGKVAIFVANIVIARVLPQDIFGQYMMLRSTISTIEGVVSGSQGSPSIKRIAEVSKTNKYPIVVSSLFMINIVMTSFLSILIFIFSDYIVHTFFMDEKNLIVGLYIGCFLLVSTTLSSVIKSILTGLEKYKLIAFSSIISSIISLPIMIFMIYEFKLYGAIFGMALYFFIDFLIKYIYFKKFYKFPIFSFNFTQVLNESKDLLLFSSPMLITIIINGITFWYARVYVLNHAANFIEIAIFDAAYQWLSIVMIITGATTSVVLPMLAKNIAEKNKDANRIFYFNLLINIVIASIIAFIFSIFSTEIMSIYGDKYKEGSIILIILSINAIFFSIAAVYNRYFIAISKPSYIMLSVLGSAICMIMYLHLSGFVDAKKLAIAFLIFYIVNTVIFIILKSKRNNYATD